MNSVLRWSVMAGVVIVFFGFLLWVVPIFSPNMGLGSTLIFISISLAVFGGFFAYFSFASKKFHQHLLAEELPKSIQSAGEVKPVVKEAYLESVKGNLSGIKINLSKDDFSIGRSRECDLQTSDVAVSRLHVRIRYGQGSWFLQDQNSKTGTFLNGKLINAKKLKSGDHIKIGENIFVFYE